MVRVGSFDSRDTAHRRHLTVPLTTAVAQSRRPFFLFKPGTKFILHGANIYCRTTTVAVSVDARIVGAEDILQAGAITVHSTPEQLAIAAGRYVAGATLVEKTAASGLTFTAAHVITASKYGVVLLQMDAAGTISSKVPVTPQAYNTAQAALDALPAPDANKVAIGYIAIANNAVDWTANTDDLTDGSDVTTAAITTYAAVASGLASAPEFVANKLVAVDASATLAAKRDVTGDKYIALEYTSDADGVVADAIVDIIWRPIPMYRDVSLGA